MGLPKRNNEYEKASKDLNSQETVSASEKIIFEQIKDDDDRAAKLVDALKDGNPLVLNFELLNVPAANKLLSFFTGACYALDGKIVKINENTYLFARKIDFIDGSLNEFISQL